ncbi:MAG: hypothetical protein FWB78_12925 [Treponema sp.]|nr:hypothetical protein [Treponema sp.]
MAQVNVRIDDNLKKKAEALFDELGLNMSTAFTFGCNFSILGWLCYREDLPMVKERT